MPLILVCGQPCSGKSHRTEQISTYLRGQGHRVLIIGVGGDGDTESTRHLRRAVIYGTAEEEKRARGAIMAAVERLLSRDVYVIVDWLNYIKGFRYQLFCVAKSCSTHYCVVECGATKEVAHARNNARDADPYSPQILDELWSRYEHPNPMNRWDKPHFAVADSDEAPPLADISTALTTGVVQPNLATRPTPVTETNFLYELDRITQEVAQAVTDAQKIPGAGVVTVPNSDRPVRLTRQVTVPELHRIRRQFLAINKVNTITDISRIGGAFVDYLNTAIDQ